MLKQPSNRLFGLSIKDKERLLKNMKRKTPQTKPVSLKKTNLMREIPEAFYRFDQLPGYYQIFVQMTVAERAGIANPFFKLHDGIDRGVAIVDDRDCISFGAYNYLDYNGDPRVSQAAKDAIDIYGTSVSASRVVSGERQIHRDLEKAVAAMYGVESCVAFVSGHATNVTTIGHLFGARDLIVHDALVHNSVMVGGVLSGADRRPFPHNDLDALDKLLGDFRHHYERVLVIVEGLYSMDGDIPDLPRLIEIKQAHKVFLMVDEAHSMGTMGAHGRGISEHFGIDARDVDLWMGTLSKTFAACGGFIAGESSVVDYLKFTSPGFLYSVGMSPPVAASALKAMELMQQEPERIEKLHWNASLFLSLAREKGLSTGFCAGISVIPVIVGSSAKTAILSNRLYDNGINVPPIIYPAVEERAARLRFFLSSAHTEDQIRITIDTVVREMAALNE